MKLAYPLLLRGLLPPAQHLVAVFLLLPQVGLALNLCLVEAVDDGVLPLSDVYPLDLRSVSTLAPPALARDLDFICARTPDSTTPDKRDHPPSSDHES